jgi:excisionase family DNA binding protein
LDGEPLISLKEAAARTGVSHSHLRLLARTGKIQAQRMGRDWFTTLRAVAEYLSDQHRERGKGRDIQSP